MPAPHVPPPPGGPATLEEIRDLVYSEIATQVTLIDHVRDLENDVINLKDGMTKLVDHLVASGLVVELKNKVSTLVDLVRTKVGAEES
jgi:hypothetical protein